MGVIACAVKECMHNECMNCQSKVINEEYKNSVYTSMPQERYSTCKQYQNINGEDYTSIEDDFAMEDAYWKEYEDYSYYDDEE